MRNRWLTGLAIFALGFGCAQMMKVTEANAQDETDGFQIVDHGNRYELINTGDIRVLAMVEYKEGMPAPEPEIGAVEGSLTVMKYGLSKVRLARLEDLELSERECNPVFEDCVEPGDPFPSPGPGPRPKHVQGFVMHPDHRMDW